MEGILTVPFNKSFPTLVLTDSLLLDTVYEDVRASVTYQHILNSLVLRMIRLFCTDVQSVFSVIDDI